MVVTRRSQSRASFGFATTTNINPNGSPTKKATTAPVQPAGQKRRFKVEASLKALGKRRGPHIMNAMARKTQLEKDPWTDDVQPTSVSCFGCKQTIQLDRRNGQYYAPNWKKHRGICKVIKAMEAGIRQRLVGPGVPGSDCTTPETRRYEVDEEESDYSAAYAENWFESSPYNVGIEGVERTSVSSAPGIQRGVHMGGLPQTSLESSPAVCEARPSGTTGPQPDEAEEQWNSTELCYAKLSGFTVAEQHAIFVLTWGEQQRLRTTPI